jgi:hypothetical protein
MGWFNGCGWFNGRQRHYVNPGGSSSLSKIINATINSSKTTMINDPARMLSGLF